MTTPLLRRFVKPLLLRNPDLIWRGVYLFVTPMRHILCGILVDACGSKNVRVIKMFLSPLFFPYERININWSTYIFRDHKLWNMTEPGIEQEFTERIESEYMTKLRNMDSIQAFSDYACDPKMDFSIGKTRYFFRIWLDMAMGNWEGAEECIALYRRPNQFKEKSIDEHIGAFEPVIKARDTKAMAALLHQWEETTVKNLKLEAWWQPSPFPLEEG